MGATAKFRENDKVKKFGDLSANNNMRFIPQGFETYGQWGENQIQLFDRLVKKGWERTKKHVQFSIIKEYWVKRLSVQVQIVQAAMILDRITRINQGKDFLSDDSGTLDNLRDTRVVI